ncbi:MAG: phosphate-starvation-inducible PsiE family protein [Desulfobacterales bacterium]|nr:phosphate-starvation-inducible PsiE family protein [Desulfobacterales bacterium]
MDDLNNSKEPLIQGLRTVIRFSVRVLAVIMTAVIIWGVVDVGWVLYKKLLTPPLFMLTMSDILATFGAFMAVLIAIEIFVNICIYLREDVIHVQIVMATALMAIARKIIILDFTTTSSDYVWAMAAVVLAMSIGYFLVLKSAGTKNKFYHHLFTRDKKQQGKVS